MSFAEVGKLRVSVCKVNTLLWGYSSIWFILLCPLKRSIVTLQFIWDFVFKYKNALKATISLWFYFSSQYFILMRIVIFYLNFDVYFNANYYFFNIRDSKFVKRPKFCSAFTHWKFIPKQKNNAFFLNFLELRLKIGNKGKAHFFLWYFLKAKKWFRIIVN